jgi:DNA polymerase III delta subunit
VAVKLIVGTDEYLVSGQARKTVDRFCPPEAQTLGLETVNGDVKTIDEAVTALKTCLGALRTVGLFGGQKTVWFRDVTLFKEGVLVKNEAVKVLLSQLAEEIKKGLPDSQHLVISAPAVDRRSAFFKVCDAAKCIEIYDLPEKSREMRTAVRGRAKELFAREHCRIAESALELFLDKVGLDTRLLAMEAEKLILYTGGGEITENDVNAITSPAAEAITWDFTDALGERRLRDALRILRQLFFQGESPVPLISAIEKLYQNLLRFRSWHDQGWVQLRNQNAVWTDGPEIDRVLSAMVADPRDMHPYRAGKLLQQAKNYTAEELIRCQKRLLRTHEQLVSSSLPPELLMEMLVIQLIGKV